MAPVSEDRPEVSRYPGGEALYRLRHSAAHVLATAVTELFPVVKVAGGPPGTLLNPVNLLAGEDCGGRASRAAGLGALSVCVVSRKVIVCVANGWISSCSVDY